MDCFNNNAVLDSVFIFGVFDPHLLFPFTSHLIESSIPAHFIGPALKHRFMKVKP